MRKSGIYNAIVFGSTGVLGSNISFELAKKDINLVLQGRSLEKLKAGKGVRSKKKSKVT